MPVNRCRVLLVGQNSSISTARLPRPSPICCCSGDAPNEPPLLTVLWIVRLAPPASSTVTVVRAPIAARFVLTPVSRRPSQSLPCPGLSNRRNVCASPGVAPPTLNTISWSPSPSRSAHATPCPLCSSPVPDEAVTSTNDFPSRLRSSTLRTIDPYDGLPLPK